MNGIRRFHWFQEDIWGRTVALNIFTFSIEMKSDIFIFPLIWEISSNLWKKNDKPEMSKFFKNKRSSHQSNDIKLNFD